MIVIVVVAIAVVVVVVVVVVVGFARPNSLHQMLIQSVNT